jgi:MYXO-CTERM domain-containing protein
LVPLSISASASAQVHITEVQPDPTGLDVAEWIEVHNTGTASVSIAGWTLADYVGNTDPARESDTQWAFPANTTLGPGEVVVVAQQATAFMAALGQVASFELAQGMDDPNIPNLTPVGMTNPIALSNNAAGDAVILRNGSGMTMSYIEWGTLDRNIPNTPFSVAPNEGESLVRIDVSGNSANDFVIATTPNPFVGFMSSGPPLILGTTVAPRFAIYGGSYAISATIMDGDGVGLVEIYLATATSSAGSAVQNYLPMTMTASGSTYSFFADQVQNLGAGLGFAEPTSFHSRYVRFFIQAEDVNNDLSVEPPNADESAASPGYLPAYVQNVLPSAPTAISDARERRGTRLAWTGHSVQVRGVALVENEVMSPGNTLFTVQDDSGAAIAFFTTATTTPAFTAGDELTLTGVLGEFRGSTQIADGTVTRTGNTGPVPVAEVTLDQILANGELFEAQLVKLVDLDFVQPQATWPSDAMAPGSWNVLATDGTNQIALRVTTGTDLFGTPAPQYGFDVVGVLNERDGSWQVFPRGLADISAHPAPPMPDAGMVDGGGGGPDGGTGGPDTGTGPGGGSNPEDDGCGCSASDRAGSSPLVLLLAGALLLGRRKRMT